MIGKVIASKSARPDAFRRLATYMTTGRPGVERVGTVRITNCESTTTDWAIREIAATQALNQRSGTSRTYHLLLSFPPGEEPDAEQLRAIEERVVTALGFGEHQRISAVHQDTDHLHVHIAINKIHPTRLTSHTPRRDFATLAQVCQQIETDFGLRPTNHGAKQTTAATRAADMEAIGARETLQGFVRRACAAELSAATNWDAVHRLLASHGMALRTRGAGLVFVSANGDAVRASAVDRGFSLWSLEARLGRFQPPRDNIDACDAGASLPGWSQAYRSGPLGSDRTDPARAALYGRYQAQRQVNVAVRTDRLARLARDLRREQETLRASITARRLVVRALALSRYEKMLLYLQIRLAFRRERERLGRQAQAQRAVIRAGTRCDSWPKWLREEAAGGDETALRLLRSRHDPSVRLAPDYLSCRDDRVVVSDALIALHGSSVRQVTSRGTVWSVLGNGAQVREDATRLYVRQNFTDADARAILRIALARFGTDLDLQGSDDFRARVVRIAAQVDPRIRLNGEDIATLSRKTEDDAASTDRSAPGRRAGGTDGPSGSTTVDRDRARRPAHAAEPGARAFGAGPPPHARDGLRALSDGALVRLRNLGQLLLPRDAHRHVEHPRAHGPDGLRRPGAHAVDPAPTVRKGGRRDA